MKRPTHRIQTSTYAGATSIVGSFLMVFGTVKFGDTMNVFQDLTWSQIMGMALPFFGGVLGMLHNEKPKIKFQK